ncbi:histone-lysine N-methyltransferase 2C [Megalops cyprinoides]|uniref:histone-lysine N-methyltransferase 2C n=1 Tax=Megalops cyprinoides TaxID=118141 RepID=UPI001865294E|nr:histone-lysine N-methyltransferase 2C [Megalops cyprinoides]
MSSEDKSLEPSDQGPSPPPGSGGTTPAGSPAPTDRRPRGRPRKDAGAPTPTPKPKKKPRSRGRAAADDDDSMDGIEMAESESALESAEWKDRHAEGEGEGEVEGESEVSVATDGPGLDRPLSPLFQRSVSEDSAGSSTLTAEEAKVSEQLCAFCYCGERSLLGQGELKLFGPTPGYVPLHIRNRRASSENDGDVDRSPEPDTPGPEPDRGTPTNVHRAGSPDSGPLSSPAGITDAFGEEPVRKFWDELGQIGLPHGINVQSLFDPTGQCCAHLRCAAWSAGVCRGEGQSLLYVDKAIDSGSTEHCVYCKRLGASIKCCAETCGRAYHYPCAAAAGTFQDIKSRTLLCPAHIQLAVQRYDEVNCALCDSPGDLLDQLFCTSCGQHYHGLCLDISASPLKRAGWQCPECKVCQTCKNPGEDSKMLVCDTCDKGYHTFCLQPVMETIPTNGWRCKNCRVCVQCGVRTSSQWHHNCLLCDGCYQQDAAPPCPLCGKALNPELHKDLLSCHTCKRCLHLECERQVGGAAEPGPRDDYVCAACKEAEREAGQSQSSPAHEVTEPALEPETDGSEGKEVGEAGPPEGGPSETPSNEEQKEAPTVLEPAQEIQVTVTVTAGPTSPQLATEEAEGGEAPLQGAPEGGSGEGPGVTEVTHTVRVEKEAEAVPAEEEEEEEEEGCRPGDPKDAPSSPAKETNAKPTVATEEEAMEVSPSTPPPMEEAGVEVSAPSTKPEGEALGVGLEEEEDEKEGEEQLGAVSESVAAPPVQMDTTPPSEHSLSDRCSPPQEDAPPERTPEMSDLARLPPSPEAPPKEVALPLSQPALAASAPPSTFIPLTPKIGMGKPAISKRKFSPGRPRVKQGAWSDRSAMSSPSWSPERLDGWDSAKTRQTPGMHLWSVKVGRGSGFPGRRRPRGANLSGRGGRGRSKLKGEIGPAATPGVSVVETFAVKEEEENAMHNTVVMFSSTDSFTLKQDMCVVCGSFGQGAEGRLLACSQCGQCYHPYCVSIKITKVVLSKGWRCLECTVCEACGKVTDPGRLLLCDDCDISYHTYCLDPPLQTVPKGGWKCKWCVSCTHCGATSPGVRCEWQNNYTQCAPCASLAVCPLCLRGYREEELVLQCQQCDRWVHASCQNLNTDEEVETAADSGFDCSMCRAHMAPSQAAAAAAATAPATATVTESNDSPVTSQIVTKKEQDQQKTYTQDGVCLTESGLSQLQSLAAAASRRKRPKPKLKLKIINQNSVAVLQTPPDARPELCRDEDPEDCREGDLLDCEGKSDSSPEREAVDEDAKGAEGADGAKKRKRKPYRPGIGGFMVRQRSRAGQGKAKRSLLRKDSTGSVSENQPGKEEGWSELMPDTPVEENAPGLESLEKVKKRYRKKKTKLEEAFPSYLQEAFFGKDLLDKSKQVRQTLETGLSDDDRSQADSKPPSAATSFLDPSSDPLLSAATTPISGKAGPLAHSEDPLVDLSEVLNAGEDILGMLSDDLGKPGDGSGLGLCPFQVENSPSPFAGLDIGPISDDHVNAPQTHPGRAQRTLPVEPLDGILSPELDKMVTDGAILSKLYKIPELEGKDVEDLFTAVLSPSTSQPPPPTATPATQGPPMPLPNPGDGMFPRMPMMNGMMGPNPHFPPNQMVPGPGPCGPGTFPPMQRMPFPDNMREKKFNPMRSEVGCPWTGPAPIPAPVPAPLPEGETDTMSNAQRSTLKWEKEETLGEMATVAPVLYTNVNFPNLKEEFPDWTTRVKQIAKLWRKASSQERAPYVQKARDNRAALRINKVQMSNESMKRQQQQAQADLFDPSLPLDSELLFKDPLKHKESEHEQEWKFRQQMRQKSKQQAKIEATQKLEQVKNEQQLQQQQQQLLQQQQQQFSGQSGGDASTGGSRSPMTPQPSNGNGSPLQPAPPKDGFARPQVPGTPASAPSDDVFVRPQPPPPAATRTPEASFAGQPAQVPPTQLFSPGSSSSSSSSSRPSSPWDPYAKMVGTPRPPPAGSSAPRRSSAGAAVEQPSPAHEPFGSPTSTGSDPYAKPPDTPRPTATADPFLKPTGLPRVSSTPEQQGRRGGGDPFARPALRAEAYQRMPQNRMILSDPYSRPLLTPIPGSNESGSLPLFKAPMPPPQSQDPYGAAPSAMRRGPSDPYEKQGLSQNDQSGPYAHPPLTPRPSMNDGFPNPPRMARHPQGKPFSQPMPMARHPSRDSFAQAPRPDYSQQSPDPYAQPPGTPRPSADPYAQPPGTPRPSSDPYAQPPGTPRPSDPYSQPPGTPRPSSDPYAKPPGTPRPSSDPYAQPPCTPRPVSLEQYPQQQQQQGPATCRPSPSHPADPYAHPPGTPRPAKSDSYAQPSGPPRPVLNDPYAQPPRTPRPGAGPEVFIRPAARPGPASHQDPFSPPQNRMQETFVRPAAPGSQTPKHSGMSDDGFAQPQPNPNQTPLHDPFEQAPVPLQPQSSERLPHEVKDQQGMVHEGNAQFPQPTGNAPEAQSSMQPPLADTEEKLRQRQRLRELILWQQQQKSAIRQEKGLQDPPMSQAPAAPGTPRHWSQEDSGSQNELFSRPPPPYPGTVRGPLMGPGGQRFPGPFPGDQRGPFPHDGQFARPQFTGDMANMGMRPHAARFGFPPGGQGAVGGQEHFVRPPHPMQGPMMDVPQQMRRSLSVDLARSLGGNAAGLPQHFPPRGLPVQQHNIMGQPFIELRHRAPENRLRLPFGAPATDGPCQPQRPQGFLDGQEVGFPGNRGPRMADPMMGQPPGAAGHLQLSSSMENLHQQPVPVNAGTEHPPLMRSLSHPVTSETFSVAPPTLLPGVASEQVDEIPIPAAEGMEEKLDADDAAVKDLEDVEVKDLDDEDLENLNLDPDDGNDLHLDDLLQSGKFDILAYTDPELDLGDKKDMFNEELDLSDPIDDHGEASDLQKALSEKRNNSAGSAASTACPSAPAPLAGKSVNPLEQGHVKRESPSGTSNPMCAVPTIKTEVKEGLSQAGERPASSHEGLPEASIQQAGVPCTAVIPGSAPVLSSLLIKDKMEDSGMAPMGSGGPLDPAAPMNQVTSLQQNPVMMMPSGGPIPDHSMNPNLTAGHAHRMDPSFPQGPGLVNPNFSHGQPPCQNFGPAVPQVDQSLPMGGQQLPHSLGPPASPAQASAQQGMFPQPMGQQNQPNRPLLLDEQPLLLQDLLDQERQEQQQQRQMQAMIRQRSTDTFFPNVDFDAITDPIMKAKMVALKGINKVMVQSTMGMSPMVMNRIQQMPGAQHPEGGAVPVPVGLDSKLEPQVARPTPPNFGPGFVNEAQRKQYEEWLQETQQLLQMQQKFLEDQIGAHRKSKKALSAKQRTAKKAGREFPEEDLEQLKHVTEQQSMVQKQLEQIRKQQKEHAELIEEYRVKQQQQCALQPPMMPGMQPQAAMMPGAPPMMAHMMPMQHHMGQPNPVRMPGTAGWQPGGPAPMSGPRMPGHLPPQMPLQHPMAGAKPPAGSGGGSSVGGNSNSNGNGGAPHVKFDDNNPFSEGFQERERKERLREQQERQRVQLMQEVERQRALQQRLEMEQHSMLGADANREPLSQMAFYNSDLPHDFMQPQRPQNQQQQGQMFPQQQQQSMQPGFSGAPYMQGGERRPMQGNGPFGPEMGPSFRAKNPMMAGAGFAPGQPRPAGGFGGPGAIPQGGAGEGPPFGAEPSMPLPPSYPGSGQSLIQLYSNIIPEEKGKKKRNRKKKKDEDAESVKTPSTPHSDLTAPLTPCVSDTSSTPTRTAPHPGEQDPSEDPSRELAGGSGVGGALGPQPAGGPRAEEPLCDIKLERTEASDCRGPVDPKTEEGMGTGVVKIEEGKEGVSPRLAGQSPAHCAKGAESSNELLKHLLKNKGAAPAAGLPRQRSDEGLRSEDEGSTDGRALQKRHTPTEPAGAAADAQPAGSPRQVGGAMSEQGKKKQRTKRAPKSSEKPASRYKKRKKEEEERQVVFSSTDTLMTQLKQQLSLLPLMEPMIGVNFAHFPPYGSGQLNGESRLSGAFGSASLDGVSDYYSQLIYKQNNLSNPPTPPASLPPTPPPVARQKMVNGFATTEELARKAAVMGGHDVTKSLVPKQLQTPFRPEDLLARAIAQGPKSVDVPASLPTPPHNNQEELRGHEHCEDRDTPDSFVPSSSPESVVGMEISRYPDLSLVKEEPPSPAPSPVIPMLPSSSGKGSEARQREVKMEPQSVFFGSQFGHPPNCSRTGLVSIAITLNPAAAENIPGVVAAVADLLCVKIPSSYEVSSSPDRGPSHPGSDPRHPGMTILRAPGPPGMMQSQLLFPSTGAAGVRGDYPLGKANPELRPQWCCHCKVVVLGNGVRKSTKDLPGAAQDSAEGRGRAEGSLVFCSHNCFLLHATAKQPKAADTKHGLCAPSDSATKESPSKIQHQYSNNMSALDVHCLAQLQPKESPPSTPPISFPSAASEAKGEPKPDPLKVTVKLKPRPRAVANGSDEGPRPQGKRWKGSRWRKWSIQVLVPKGAPRLPAEDEVDELLQKLGASLRPDPLPRDLRRCCFCHEEGDGVTDGPARLLNLDVDLWVHLNCALWSTEVYETQAGALINVELALRRGLSVRCAYCQRTGATSGCHRLRCANVYHFTCALKAQCTFFKDKTMLCHQHRPRGCAQEQELRYFAVFRRVYVQRDEVRQLAGVVRRGEREHTLRVGSLIFHAVGQLLPQQMRAFHAPAAIFPVGYEATRIYWSMRHGGRRCRYLCGIDEKDGRPEFSIRVLEQGHEELVLTDTTPKGVWDKVLQPVAERRAECGTLKLFPAYLKGEDLFGLTVSAVTRIVESLPGVEACDRYTFRYGRNPLMELPLAVNPTGCARSEPKASSHVKRFVLRPHTLTSTSSSKSFQSTVTGEISAPYSKQFVHSKSSQYRKMKTEWKSNVYLARSRIQGLGLYAAKDIEKYTMVIEYIGTIIRNEVANRKEKMYESQNRGVYMFRIDSEHVIDATITGGPARYINHSCAPNCTAEAVTFEKGHKIIISSNRRIQRGEELCYDYKFDLEDDQHKIPCHCGAVNCRKWMN